MLDPLHSVVPATHVRLPTDWARVAKSGLVFGVALARRALLYVRGECAVSSLERVRWQGERDRLKNEIELQRREIRIKDARVACIPARERPHYPPILRLEILLLQAARGWSKKQTADTFLVTPATIGSWTQRKDDLGDDALVRAPVPVNKMPDFVTYLVQQLRVLCPTMGKVRLSEALAREGLRLAYSTTARMIKSDPVSAPPDPTPSTTTSAEEPAAATTRHALAPEPKRRRTVTSKYANHVWGMDLTAVPTADGFYVPWLPHAEPQSWPTAWWILLIEDHYSRRIVGFEVFPRLPSAEDACAVLDTTIASTGHAPKYMVTDQGPQFREAYRDWCEANHVKPRFGALGRHGSIAVVERLIRTVKSEGLRRILVPLTVDDMRAALGRYARWYNEHRPHQSLRGATPEEIFHGRVPKNTLPTLEPRARYPADSPGARPIRGEKGCRLKLVVEPFEGAAHLPLVRLETIAA